MVLRQETNDFNFEDYVSIDNDLSIGAQNRDEDIVKATQEKITGVSDVILQSDEDDDEASQPPKVITRGQANDCINKLREFFQSKSYQVDDQLQRLSDLETMINVVHSNKQTSIIDFFKKN